MACVHVDLLKMIGRDTVVCARCQKAINPRGGHWYHMAGKEHPDFLGYHVPQVIMPMHYENSGKWADLLYKMEGGNNYSAQKFHNEILGESADFGVKLISLSDIQAASKLPPIDVRSRSSFIAACERLKHCSMVTMGVDWGGGGETEVSFTAVAITGLNVNGNKRLPK
jgi:hypothetical protein